MYKPDCSLPANYRGGVKSFHFASLLYSTVHLNLNCSLVFLVKSFFSVLSSPERTKVPGTRALESLAPRLKLLQGNIPRSSLACRYKPFCRVQGAAERCCQRAQRKLACRLHGECSTFKPKATHSARVFKENYTRAPLKHSHTIACTRQGSPLSQLRCRRSFEVTFARDIYCELLVALIEQLFLPIHFSCPLSQGGRDSLLSGGG